MIRPTLRQLSFLVALADEGSFVAAAERAGITQPSLTVAIQALEAVLRVRLVERGRSGASLTPAGEAAVAHARSILAAVDALGEAVGEAGEMLSGPFRLGVIPTIAPFLLPAALAEARQRHPRLKLYLREDLTVRLIEALRARSLDAALIALPHTAPGIETMALFDDEFLFVGPQSHPLSSKDGLRVEDLEGARLLLLEDGHCLRDHVIGACGAQRSAGPDLRATSLFTLVQMAASDLGVSLLPRLAVQAGLTAPGLVARRFSPPVVGRQVGLAWRRGSGRVAEIRALAGLLTPPAYDGA